ncbi:MAG: hypothetical protein J6A36_02820 [Clostridia bacterium]|nr:hypothetical protein [Clostridia bacterium]
MSKTNKLVIVIAVILIIVCLVAGNINKNAKENVAESNEKDREITYNTVTNELTGTEEYIVYDKDTGKEITRVDEEHQLKIYEIDPNYEEIPVEDTEFENGGFLE